jgi:hypothetical protein
MARFKPVREKKGTKTTARGAIPCLILVLTGMLLVSWLFFSMLKSG